MFHQPKLLVCTDFSPESDKALQMAAKYAQKTQGELYLLHVANIIFYSEWFDSSSHPEERKHEFKHFIQEDMLKKMREQMKKCAVDAKALIQFEASPMEGIQKVCHELRIDVIVVGNREVKGLDRYLIGSLTRKLIFQSDVPVLAIKKDIWPESFAALVRGEDELDEIAGVTRELCSVFSARPQVISVYPKIPGTYFGNALEFSSSITSALDEASEEFITNMKEKITKTLGPGAKTCVTSSFDPSATIVEALHEVPATTAVLKRSQKSRLNRFLERSVSEELLEKYDGNFLFY